MRQLVLRDGVRPDGRGTGDVRPIAARAGMLPRTHGSALFTRGETQALAVTTLGAIAPGAQGSSSRACNGTPALAAVDLLDMVPAGSRCARLQLTACPTSSWAAYGNQGVC